MLHAKEGIVTVLERFDSFLIYLLLAALFVGFEHMAFRGAKWQRRELARRAVGIETVMLLGLIVVWDGDADLTTWAMIQAAFLVAGLVKVVAGYIDTLRGNALRSALMNHDNPQTD